MPKIWDRRVGEKKRKIWMVSGFGGAALPGELEWLLYDEFTTAESAPITSPRTCEPGPGTLTIVDTGNNFDIVSGELIATGLVGTGDPGFHGDLSGDISVRTPGLAVFASDRAALTGETQTALDDTWDVTPNEACIHRDGAPLRIFDTSGIVVDSTFYSVDTYYSELVVNRSKGSFFIVDGKLYWVGDVNTLVLDTAIWSTRALASNTRLSHFGALSLPANGYSEWGADFSTVTDTKTNPAPATQMDRNAASASFEMSWTYEDSKFCGSLIRYVDATHWVGVGATGGSAQCLVRYQDGGSIITLATISSAFTDGVATNMKVVDDVDGTVSTYVDNFLIDSRVIPYSLGVASASQIYHNLATNDIVITTYPNPALGIATDRVIAPQTTDTFTHAADFLAYIRNVTLPTAGSTEYFFRITGADEITLQLASDGSLVLLDNATSRITAGAATITDGDDVALICEGANGEVFVAGTSAGSTSAIAVIAGVSGKRLDAQDGVCDSIELFPRDVSGLLPSELV